MMPTTRRRLLASGLAWVLVPGLSRAQQCRPTPRDALGPFYKPGAPAEDDLCAGAAERAKKLVVSGRVVGMPDCIPLDAALVEVWQADERGDYSLVGAKRDDERCLLRAALKTDANGRYRYTTVLPGEYPGRPRHIHYRVSRAGYATLVTQLYFDRNRGVPDRLIASAAADGSGTLQAAFDIALARG